MANNKVPPIAAWTGRQVSRCQIIFPEDESHSTTREPIRLSGDELSGYLKVVTEADAGIEVDIVFEGQFFNDCIQFKYSSLPR